MESELDRETDQVKIIEETPTTYVIEDEKGVNRTLYKIDRDKIAEYHHQSINKVAVALTPDDFQNMVTVLSNVLNNTPTIDSYLLIAQNISSYLKKLYDQIGAPNILWHPIKNIDPDIYGRAETLSNELSDLCNIMNEVGREMEELGKIRDFKFTAENCETRYEELPRKATTSYIGVNFSFAI